MKRYLILLCLCFTQFAFAETLKLDLQSSINLAYEKNSDLKRQKIVLDAAERSFKQSYNSLIPSIYLSAGDTYIFPDEEPANILNLEGTFSLNLKTSLKSSADKNKINYELEKANYENACAEVRKSVCDSYFEILEMQQQVFLKSENSRNLKEVYEENQIKYKKGFLNETEYQNSKILYEKSKSELLGLQLELKNLINVFKVSLGIPVERDIYCEGNLAEFLASYLKNFTDEKKTQLSNFAKNDNLPELKLLLLQKKILEKELQIKKMETYGPDFNFSYQVNPVLGSRDFKGKINNTLNAGISIPLDNLIPSSKGREEINFSNDQLKDMEIQISAKRQEVELNLINQLLLVNQKMETLTTYKSLVDITNNNLNICKESYSKGMFDFQIA